MKQFRLSDPHPQSSPAPQKVSRGTALLLGSLCAVAVVLSGVVAAGFVMADPTETASEIRPKQAQVAPRAPAAGEELEAAAAVSSVSTTKAARAMPAPIKVKTQVVPAALPAVNDVRWGGDAVAAADTGTARLEEAGTRLAAGPDERGGIQDEAQASGILADLKGTSPPDISATASINAGGISGDVPVAESEAEVAKLEAATGMIEGQTEALPAMTTARVTKYVNLRSGPADEARVIAVVPANAEVKVESRCQWCIVVYNGQRGYIYKNFIRRSLKEAAAEGSGLF